MLTKVSLLLLGVCAAVVIAIPAAERSSIGEDDVVLPYYGFDGYPHYFDAAPVQKRSAYDYPGKLSVSGYPTGVPEDPHHRTKKSAFPDVEWGLWSHNCRPCRDFDALNPCCRK